MPLSRVDAFDLMHTRVAMSWHHRRPTIQPHVFNYGYLVDDYFNLQEHLATPRRLHQLLQLHLAPRLRLLSNINNRRRLLQLLGIAVSTTSTRHRLLRHGIDYFDYVSRLEN